MSVILRRRSEGELAALLALPLAGLLSSSCGDVTIVVADEPGIIRTAVGPEAGVQGPEAVAIGEDGALVVADTRSHRILRVDPLGGVEVLAGTGEAGFSGDGGPARSARLEDPAGVAVAPDGAVFIADSRNHVVRLIDPSGTISTVVGQGERPGTIGLEGPAVEALLNLPTGLALAPDGTLFISDTGNNRVVALTTDGFLLLVAGRGVSGFSGDGGPASEATLNLPRGLALDAAGSLYIADLRAHRVRVVGKGQIIRTVVGDGFARFNGDGRRGVETSLSSPVGLAFDARGNLYIGDRDNNRVRRVDEDRIVVTIAGDGTKEFGGDGVPAVESGLGGPRELAVAPGDILFIAEGENNRVRRMALP